MKAAMKSATPCPFSSLGSTGWSKFGCVSSSLPSARVAASICVALVKGFSFREMGGWNFPFYKRGETHSLLGRTSA